MRILILEDRVQEARNLRTALESAGHAVVNLVTVRGATARRIAGTELDGGDVVLDTGEFQLAFVDGYLGAHSKLHGWDVMPALTAAGVMSIGCSSDAEFNERLIAAGATGALLKRQVVDWVRLHFGPVPSTCPPGITTGGGVDGADKQARVAAYSQRTIEQIRALCRRLN